jgi:hypothetical protein
MTDDPKALAFELARDFDGEYGGRVSAALRDMGQSRSFGLGDALGVAGLLLSGVQIAMQWKSDKQMSDLRTLLDEMLGRPEKVSADKRASVIGRIVARFRGPDGK